MGSLSGSSYMKRKSDLLVVEPMPPEEACTACNGTGLVPGMRKTYEGGAWTYVYTKYRATCPDCHGLRKA